MLQRPFPLTQGRCSFLIVLALGKLSRNGDDETEAILQVVLLCGREKPFPIEFRMSCDHPRQGFHQPSIEILTSEGSDEQLRRIQLPRVPQVGEPRVSQS